MEVEVGGCSLVERSAEKTQPPVMKRPRSAEPTAEVGEKVAARATEVKVSKLAIPPAALPATPSATPPAASSAPWVLAVGASVLARYGASSIGKFGTKWYQGSVVALYQDGKADIRYADGDFEQGVLPQFIKPPKAVA